MQPGSAIGRSLPAVHTTNGTRAFFAVALVTAAVLGVFAPTTWSMIEIWVRSDTFVHGFLVIPAFLYFVWIRRGVLAELPMQPYWPGVLAVVASGSLWLLAELAGALAPAQFGAVGLVPAALLTLFGRRWFGALLFPCAFLFFAVPFGEVFVPTLIQWTADVTIAALRLSGVPVYREGTFFVIPSGQWSVVDACSGIRYLIASAMTGALFAWLMFRSPAKRALFMLAALVVPILANWLRAYVVVMLGHLSGNRIAAGVDHLVYGWLLFGIVIFVLFALGSRWRDAPGSDGAARAALAREVAPARGSAPAFAAVAVLIVMWPLARAAMMAPLGGALPPSPAPLPVSGWKVAAPFSEWRASTQRPSIEQVVYFENDGNAVGVQMSVYRDQVEGAELVGWANRLVVPAMKPAWRVAAQSAGTWSDHGGAYRESVLKADRQLLVRDWYWLGNSTTTSEVRAKIDLAIDRLTRHDDTSAWVIVFTPVREDVDAARATLESFQREMGPSIMAALQGLRR